MVLWGFPKSNKQQEREVAVILNESVPMVSLQFSFTNPEVIPVLVRHRSNETTEDRVVRTSHASGRLVIEPTEKCSVATVSVGIESAGYELVDAFHQERIDPKDPTGRRRYHTVRFQFARHEVAKVSEEFKTIRDQIHGESELFSTRFTRTARKFRARTPGALTSRHAVRFSIPTVSPCWFGERMKKAIASAMVQYHPDSTFSK